MQRGPWEDPGAEAGKVSCISVANVVNLHAVVTTKQPLRHTVLGSISLEAKTIGGYKNMIRFIMDLLELKRILASEILDIRISECMVEGKREFSQIAPDSRIITRGEPGFRCPTPGCGKILKMPQHRVPFRCGCCGYEFVIQNDTIRLIRRVGKHGKHSVSGYV